MPCQRARLWSRLIAGAVALWLGLAVAMAAGKKTEESVAPPVWPAPPEAPRIQYVQSITRPADIGAKRSGFGRVANWFTGSDKGNEPLRKPFGLALDEDDNLCITDTDANAVYFLDRVKKKAQRWENLGNLKFSAPVAVAKRKGIIYVADSGLGSVVVFDLKGTLHFQITNRFERPCGLAMSGEKLFVVDSQRHDVVAFDLGGHYLAAFGQRGTGPGDFNFPTHIAGDSVDNIFVTDSMNSRVERFDANGKFGCQIGSAGDSTGQFSRPKGVAVDSFGHVYVVDGIFDNLQIFDREGRFLLNLGDAGPRPGQFWLPNGIAISRSNEIFVADSYNHRVQMFKYIGPP